MNLVTTKAKYIFPAVLALVLIFLPVVLFAAPPLVPCSSADPGSPPGSNPDYCDYYKLIELGQNLINFFVLISIPLAAIAFAWAGFLFMTAGGNESKISHAKSIGLKVLIGFLVILSAWLIVYLITSNLLKFSTPLGAPVAT